MIAAEPPTVGSGVWVDASVLSMVIAGKAKVCVAVGSGVSEVVPPPQPAKSTSSKRAEAINLLEDFIFMGSILPQPITMQKILRLYRMLPGYRPASP
jgi:hypothetical protein